MLDKRKQYAADHGLTGLQEDEAAMAAVYLPMNLARRGMDKETGLHVLLHLTHLHLRKSRLWLSVFSGGIYVGFLSFPYPRPGSISSNL
jgi:hypothetical protein